MWSWGGACIVPRSLFLTRVHTGAQGVAANGILFLRHRTSFIDTECMSPQMQEPRRIRKLHLTRLRGAPVAKWRQQLRITLRNLTLIY